MVKMIDMAVSASQLRAARAALDLRIRDVAAVAGVSPNTVTRLEAGEPVNHSTMVVICQAYEAAGVDFLDGNGIRRRASA